MSRPAKANNVKQRTALTSSPTTLPHSISTTETPDNSTSQPTDSETMAVDANDGTLINVIDLEATCFQPWKGETQDVIEIGISVVDRTTNTVTTTESILVHPTHSTVTAFCTELTTLTAQQVQDGGVSFEAAMRVLEERYHLSTRLFASYGAFDIRLLRRQVEREGLSVRLPVSYVNVKKLVAMSYRRKKQCGMMTALVEVCGLKHVGVHHRGDDDSRNIAALLLHLIKRHANDKIIQKNIQNVATVR